MNDPKKDIPTLHKYAKHLQVLAEGVVEKGFKYNESDHLGFMLISFLMKQQDHMKSVCILVEAGQYGDATAISRIMLEGTCTLLWSASDPDERPLQWRAYALVTDWNLMQDRKKNGEVINPIVEDKLRDRLKVYGDKYHTKKAKKVGPDNLEFPFQKTWLLDKDGAHVPRGEIFKKVNGTELYALYEDFSQWVHWTPRGLGEFIKRDKNGTTFNPNLYHKAAQSLAVGVQAMFQTLELVFDHFNLDSQPDLKTLKDGYIEELQIKI